MKAVNLPASRILPSLCSAHGLNQVVRAVAGIEGGVGGAIGVEPGNVVPGLPAPALELAAGDDFSVRLHEHGRDLDLEFEVVLGGEALIEGTVAVKPARPGHISPAIKENWPPTKILPSLCKARDWIGPSGPMPMWKVGRSRPGAAARNPAEVSPNRGALKLAEFELNRAARAVDLETNIVVE